MDRSEEAGATLHADEPKLSLSQEEAAQGAGTTSARVQNLVDRGILKPERGRFEPSDVLRAQVVGALEAAGIDVADVATALASGDLTLGYLEGQVERPSRADLTFAQLADDIGIGFPRVEKLYIAMGLPTPTSNELVRDDDLGFIRALPVLFGAGVDEGEVLRAVRIWGDSARRVAQYQTHHLHNSIEGPFRRRGLRDNEAFEAAMDEVGLGMKHTGEQMLAWLYRRHSEAFTREHVFQHAETALEDAGLHRKAAQPAEGCVFADLSGYTRLTEESGDEAAAKVSLALAQLVSEIASAHRGEVVKMLGDGVFFHFKDPNDALMASLGMVAAVRPRGLPPAHVGIEAGSMIYDEGDYFGRTVNIAARIAAQAGPDQVLVGEGMARFIRPAGVRLVEVGAFDLKGISRPMTLCEAVGDPASEQAE